MSAVACNAQAVDAHYVAVNKNWFETSDESKYWGKLFLSEEDWEVPPPPWASEKNSDDYRSWEEEERQKLFKEEEKEAVVDIKGRWGRISLECQMLAIKRPKGGEATGRQVE